MQIHTDFHIYKHNKASKKIRSISISRKIFIIFVSLLGAHCTTCTGVLLLFWNWIAGQVCMSNKHLRDTYPSLHELCSGNSFVILILLVHVLKQSSLTVNYVYVNLDWEIEREILSIHIFKTHSTSDGKLVCEVYFQLYVNLFR